MQPILEGGNPIRPRVHIGYMAMLVAIQMQCSFFSTAAAQLLQLSSSSSSAFTAQQQLSFQPRQQLNNCSPFQPEQPCSTNSLAASTALQRQQPCSVNSLAALTALQNYQPCSVKSLDSHAAALTALQVL